MRLVIAQASYGSSVSNPAEALVDIGARVMATIMKGRIALIMLVIPLRIIKEGIHLLLML